MKIEGIEQNSLDILRGERLQREQKVTAEVARANKEAAAADHVESSGIDFALLGEAHTLDPARVAALIADPFGED